MKQKALYGWKLCFYDQTSLCHNDSFVQYSLKKYTKPQKNCGPLAVFKTRKLARQYFQGFNGYIFKCKYIPSNHKHLWNYYCAETDLPDGTDFASKVMLLKRAR